MIYDQIKAGYPVSREAIMEVIDHMRSKGCDAVIMGCTELSVIYRDLKLRETCEDVIDSLWGAGSQHRLKKRETAARLSGRFFKNE